jgi:hypothetical protein
MRFRRFCPTCGVQRPAVNYQCVICGSPVRLAGHRRGTQRAATAVSWADNVTRLSIAQARARSEGPAAA